METEGRIQGGHIFCMSPSARDVIPITRNKGQGRRGEVWVEGVWITSCSFIFAAIKHIFSSFSFYIFSTVCMYATGFLGGVFYIRIVDV